MTLSEEEKAEIRACLDRGEPVPDKYRWKLFAQARETELIWPGKTGEVTNVVLPFQVIEHVDEPRVENEATTGDLFATGQKSGRQSAGWSNKLIWGDNKLVLSSLKNGPLRREIEASGGLKLVYIDPPFDVGADFSIDIEVGEETLTKEPSVIEDVAYRDTWGNGADLFIAMFYERLVLIRDLLSEDGSIYVHCDWRLSAALKCVLDEVMGSDNYVNEIIWHYKRWPAPSRNFQKMHDTIFFFGKSANNRIWNPQLQALTEGTMKRWRGQKSKVEFTGGVRQVTQMTEEKSAGTSVDDVWNTPVINSQAIERVNYPTQKPEALIERIVFASTSPGDLVADFFCGSGTTLAVAEKHGRKWIGCDLGRFAIHTSRKRLIGVQRELKKEHQSYRSFEILNLGKYERQYFAGIDPTLPEEQRRVLSIQKEEHFTGIILTAYKAERVFQSPPFQGRKGSALICVGPIDAPVTESLISEAVEAARKLGVTQLDVLGFEFEMGLFPRVVDEARGRGVRIATRYIPKDVFDRRAVEKGQVTFYDVAYLDVKAKVKGREVTVSLTDFAVSYRQEDADALAGEMKPGGSKVTVDGGQVVKISKDKKGIVLREALTKQWTDWIDYWSVDFDYRSKQEIITVTAPDSTGKMVDRPQWTGGYIFENEWQSFRTRRDRKLELTSASHVYGASGRYYVAVKVIDIFGNDTTKVVEVVV